VILAVAQSSAALRDLPRNIAEHVRLTIVAAHHGAGLLVFPELSLTGYSQGLTRGDALDPSDPRFAPLQFLANQHTIVIVAGAPIASSAGLHIGAIVFAPRQPARIHLKQYLHSGEEVAFVPGVPGAPVDVEDVRVGLAICADVTHPEHPRDAAAQGCNVYAAGAVITPGGYDADAALLRGHARRHQMLVMLANHGAATGGWETAGRSAVWSPEGTLLASAPPSGQALVFAERVDGRWRGDVLGLFAPAGA
jgi:predicted amidohydrolase